VNEFFLKFFLPGVIQPFQGWPNYVVFFVRGLHPWLLKFMHFGQSL